MIPARPRFDPDAAAQQSFESAARAAGFDPADRWVGGYADYEWDHLRPALAAYGIDVADRDVLEFGCNVGGSAVILAALGARLSAVDIDPALAVLTQANLARHGLGGAVAAVGRGDPLPSGDARFDLVLANSVLEYVEPHRLDAVIAEFHRVLKPGGRLFICGTASRLALRERHSGRWLVNYRPTAIDRLTGHAPQRGLSPRKLAHALRGRFVTIAPQGWLATRQAIHGSASFPARAHAGLGRMLGRSPGWLAPYIELLLERR